MSLAISNLNLAPTLEVVEGPRGRVCVDLAHVGAGIVDGDAADGEDEHVAALVVDHADPLVRRHPRRARREELRCFVKKVA